MNRFLCLILLLMLVAACDSQRDYSDEETIVVEEQTYEIRYRVEGTYASCDVRFTDPSTGVSTANDVRLPWEIVVTVTVDQTTGPFDASVSATCADSNKMGKSTSAIFIDGDVIDQGSAVGFGATSEANVMVGDNS